jgi:aminopeptidase N
MEEIRRAVLSSRVVAERPVIDTAERDLMALLNENSYQKGGFVLHMLRTTLGDSAFFRALRRYYDRYRNGNALSDDLRRELEASSGRPLGWFFDQWLRRPGFPELTTSWTYDAAAKRVILSIIQGARFGSYRFPLTIDIKTAAGRWVRTRAEVPAQTRTQVTLDPPLNAAPAELVFDPDVELLARMVKQ